MGSLSISKKILTAYFTLIFASCLFFLSGPNIYAQGTSAGVEGQLPSGTGGISAGVEGQLQNNQGGQYVPLTSIGNYVPAGGVPLSTYLQNLFKLGVAVCTGLAVIMIVIGGMEYMTTDAIGGKSEGIAKIESALWGLALVLVSYILLKTINPDFLKGDFTVQQATGVVNPIESSVGHLNLPTPTNFVGGLNLSSNPFANVSVYNPGNLDSSGNPINPAGDPFGDISIYNGNSSQNPFGLDTSGDFGAGPVLDASGNLINTPSNGLDNLYNNVSYYEGDNNGNTIIHYNDGSYNILYVDDNGNYNGGMEFYNSQGQRVIGGQTVSYTGYDGNGNEVINYNDGSYVIRYTDDNGNLTGGTEVYNADGNRVINGKVSDYSYYNADGNLVSHFTDGTQAISTGNGTIPNSPSNGSSLAAYRAHGAFLVYDHGGHPGYIDPTIAYLEHAVPQDFPWAHASSDYRSPGYNAAVGGSPTSQHPNGEAVDFFGYQSAITTSQGNALVQWAISNGSTYGFNQIIWQGVIYNSHDGGVSWTSGVGSDHYDHVHLGRPGSCCG